jgi:hypothetical protein
MKRTGGPKRSGIKRVASEFKRAAVNPVSDKRKKLNPERRAFVARILAERPRCEGPSYLRTIVAELHGVDQSIVLSALRACGLNARSTEVHEKLKRSRGGSIVDDANVAALCRRCHRFTEEYPRLSTMAGLLIPSWQRRA